MDLIQSPITGPTLAGSVLGGALLRGWTGPASRRSTGAKGAAYNHAGSWGPMHWTHGGSSLHTCSGPDLDLDCRRPEVRDRIVRVLAKGEKCPGCHQGWAPAVGPMGEPDGTPCEVCGGKTRGCIPGTGYTRAPVHLGHITDAERQKIITAEVAAWLLWVSVLRAEAGLPPIGAGVTFHYGGNHLLLPHPNGVMRVDLEQP